MVTDRVGPTITTLKAEVDFLSDELRQAKAENKQLLEENFSLSTWQCVYTDGKTGLAGDEHGNQYCAMARENERLRAANETWASAYHAEYYANERLRAALEEIAKVTRGWEPGVWSDEEGREYFAMLFFSAQRVARAALAAQPAPGKVEPRTDSRYNNAERIFGDD